MGRGKEAYSGRRSHDSYARDALAPIRGSLLTLYRSIQEHSGKDRLTFFISEYGAEYGLTPDNIYLGNIAPIDEVALQELIARARLEGFIPDPFAYLSSDEV